MSEFKCKLKGVTMSEFKCKLIDDDNYDCLECKIFDKCVVLQSMIIYDRMLCNEYITDNISEDELS